MRAIWKGALAFGMVSIPVRLYSATEDRDVSFHQVHDEDAGRVRYQRMCTVCDKEVAYADLAKGFELPSGETVLLTDEDFANLPLPTTKVVELVAFVPADQVDPLALARGYYLEPDPAGRKPYELLRAALERTSRVGLAKIAVRSKESLAVLRPRGDVLALQTMVSTPADSQQILARARAAQAAFERTRRDDRIPGRPSRRICDHARRRSCSGRRRARRPRV